MFRNTLPILAILGSFTRRHVLAQGDTTPVGPLVACDLTTFQCYGPGECCPIGACCGSGCCPLGYSCINQGTADQACCLGSDPTQCGTIDPNDSNNGGGSKNECIGIDNCPRDPERGLAWTCLLGETCGLRYNECYPCIPSSGGDGDESGDDFGNNSMDNSSPTPATSSSSSSDPISSSDDTSSEEDGSSSNSSDDSNAGHLVGDFSMKLFALLNLWAVLL